MAIAILTVLAGCGEPPAQSHRAQRFLQLSGILDQLALQRANARQTMLDRAEIPELRAAVEQWLEGRELFAIESQLEQSVRERMSDADLETAITFLETGPGLLLRRLGTNSSHRQLVSDLLAEPGAQSLRDYFGEHYGEVDRFLATPVGARVLNLKLGQDAVLVEPLFSAIDAIGDELAALAEKVLGPDGPADEDENAPAPGTTRVVVARGDLPGGTKLDTQTLTWRDVKDTELPEDAFLRANNEASRIIGGVLKTDLADGDTVTWQHVDHQLIVVPRSDLPAGTVIDDDNLAVRHFVTTRVPVDAITDERYQGVRGRALVRAIAAGNPLTMSALADD